MPKTLAQKTTEVQEIAARFTAAKSVVFADLSRLKVNELTSLRRNAQKDAVVISASKKTLLRRALDNAGLSAISTDSLAGSVSMLFGTADEVAPAKVLTAFAKDKEQVKLLGGILESKWMSSQEVKALSALPSRDMLIAQVVGTLRAPLAGMVGVLQGNLRNFVYALNAIKESKS